MATYVVDKRTGNDSNTGLSSAQAWKTLRKANGTSLPTGTHTVEIAQGSGPYIITDLGNQSQNSMYLQQGAGSVITWNFNGNELRADPNVNDGSKKWTRSTSVGKEDWYYLTEQNGSAPLSTLWDGTSTSLPATETCMIDGNWSCASTNLNNPPYISPGQGFALYGRYLSNNWAWGNWDALAFSTLYVRVGSGIDPTGTGIEIRPNGQSATTLINGGYANSLHIFNDGVFSGAKTSIISGSFGVEANRCVFKNAGWQGINAAASTLLQSFSARFCKFIDCGHAGIYCEKQHNVNAYHSHFENVHTAVKIIADAAYVVNYYNNTTKNLLAGVIQKDVATPTFNEDYNQHHIDPNTTHGGPAIAFTTGTRRWTTTGAHDFPASAATTGMGVDMVNSGGVIPNGLSRLVHGALVVSGVNDAGQKDIAGVASGRYPNIGADQFDYAPGFGPYATCDGALPLSAQPCKSHALPVGTRKITAFPGVATAAQINEAAE